GARGGLGSFFFFFQAEDGIRVFHVTGVQTCALPIFDGSRARTDERTPLREVVRVEQPRGGHLDVGRVAHVGEGVREGGPHRLDQIGRASGREREESWGGAGGSEEDRREG